MKKKIMNLSTLLLVVILLFSFTSCGPKPSGEDTSLDTSDEPVSELEEIELTMWHSALTMPNEAEKPEAEWEINKLIKEFEDANPGVTIKSEYNSDQTANQNKLKASVLAGNAPDIINIFSGYLVSSLGEVFVDITPYIPTDDLELITGWQTVSKDLQMGNPIYGYPASGAEIGCLVYNKSLVAAAGVDLEGDAKPKNAAEFYDAMKKIQETGVQPIIASDSGYNAAWMFPFGAWWTQYVGTERVTSNSMGSTKFVDDEAFIKTLDFVAQMYKDGFINKDYTTIADPSSEFYNGKAAMMVTGNWELQNCIDMLGEDAGLYTVPSFDSDVKYSDAALGGVGQALCVVNTSEKPEIAVKFLSFYSEKENVINFAKKMSKIPQRTDVTSEELGWTGNALFEKQLKIANTNLFGWNDNAMQPDVMNEYYIQTSLAVIGTITAEECAEALDKKAAEANK